MKIKPQVIEDMATGLRITFSGEDDEMGEMKIEPIGPFLVSARDLCFDADGENFATSSHFDDSVLDLKNTFGLSLYGAYTLGREMQKPDGDELDDEIRSMIEFAMETLYKDADEFLNGDKHD